MSYPKAAEVRLLVEYSKLHSGNDYSQAHHITRIYTTQLISLTVQPMDLRPRPLQVKQFLEISANVYHQLALNSPTSGIHRKPDLIFFVHSLGKYFRVRHQSFYYNNHNTHILQMTYNNVYNQNSKEVDSLMRSKNCCIECYCL